MSKSERRKRGMERVKGRERSRRRQRQERKRKKNGEGKRAGGEKGDGEGDRECERAASPAVTQSQHSIVIPAVHSPMREALFAERDLRFYGLVHKQVATTEEGNVDITLCITNDLRFLRPCTSETLTRSKKYIKCMKKKINNSKLIYR